MIVPTGDSFNLDGAAIDLSLAALYIAQATSPPLSLGRQLGLLAVSLLTSEGAAGVAFHRPDRHAVDRQHGPPPAGILLIFGIDGFMSECRALVNFYGNAVATPVIAKWDGDLDLDRARQVIADRTSSERSAVTAAEESVLGRETSPARLLDGTSTPAESDTTAGMTW